MRYNLVLAVLIALLFACSKARCPKPVATYIVTLQPGAADGRDVKVSSIVPTETSASYNYLAIQTWIVGGDTNIQRTLIDFDYSSIPSGATIVKAVLTLYADTTDDLSGLYPPGHYHDTSGSNSWKLNRITSPWNIQTVSFQSLPNIDHSTSILLPASTSASEPYSIDVTKFVQDQLASPSLYYGFMMRLVTEHTYNGLYFYSSRDSHMELHPKMAVRYIK